MSDPLLVAWRARSRNRLRAEGWAAGVAEQVAPMVAAAVLAPLLKPVFLSFLDGPTGGWGEGMAGAALRAGLLVVALLSLDVYEALIRSPDRAVLAVLPVDPGAVVRAELLRVAARRWWLVPGLAVVLAPAALAGASGLWLAGLGLVVGAYAAGLAVSAWVHLRAVDAAEDPTWAPLLDLVRGSNPRQQAAFLYAPGVVVLACGAAVYAASLGVEAVGRGELSGALWLVAPLPLAAAALLGLPARSESWYPGGLVLAEIDARHATFEDPEEARRVYLDWVVRFLPVGAATWALKDLRHGWRARRSWISGAWLLAFGALVAGWSATGLGPARAAQVAVAAAWLCGAIGVLLDADEPEFLAAWLPDGGADRRLARLAVLLLWLQPPAWLGALSVLVRRGAADAAGVWVAGILSAAFAAVFAMACGRLGRRGLAVYAPVGAVGAGALAALVGS